MIIRGINLGNALEAAHEGDWGVVLQPGYFSTIHQAGFDTVRVPILWTAHTGPGPGYTMDPAFFQRIDWVVAQARASHLNAILDYHNDGELMKDPAAYGDRFVTIWKQIADHYQAEPDEVLFELLNEPNGKLDAPHWNTLLARALAVIRPTNPTRTVVVGPVQWNSPSRLPDLSLPDDDHHLLATFHYYDPMQFTHQGASWIDGSNAWLGTKWEGTEAQKAGIAHDFGAALDWARRFFWGSSAPSARATSIPACAGRAVAPAPPRISASAGVIGNSAQASARMIRSRSSGGSLCLMR